MSIHIGKNTIALKIKLDINKVNRLNTEIEQKKLQIKENIDNLILILLRILKNDELKMISFEKIYSLTYKICNEKAHKELYESFTLSILNHLNEIYKEIEKYILSFEEIAEFINKLIECYRDFSYKIGIIQKTMMYYEKNFLEKQNVYEENIREIANNIFFTIFINEKTRHKVVEFIIKIINNDRNRIFVDKILLRNLINFFLEIKPKEFAYKEIIERKLVESSIEYFKFNLLEKCFNNKLNIESGNVNEYFLFSNFFEEIYRAINEEDIRYTELNLLLSRKELLDKILEILLLEIFNKSDTINRFLMQMIENPDKKLICLIKNIMDFSEIKKPKCSTTNDKLKIFNNNFIFLDQERDEKLQESQIIKNLKDNFYNKIAEALEILGKKIIQEEKNKFEENKSNVNHPVEHIITLIERLIKLIENVEIIQAESNICQNKEYSKLIHTKLVIIINNKFAKNQKNEYKQNNFLNISKNLAIHIDYKIKNYPNKFSYEYMLNYIEKIISIFKLLEDKDIFEINNRKFLGQRILSNVYNEDIELRLIKNLKLENGTIFTFRSEIMINDIKNSNNILENYKTSQFNYKHHKDLNDYKNVELNVRILTQGSWILNSEEHVNSKDLLLFIETNERFTFLKILDKFNDFYKASFPGKILNHSLTNSTCEFYCKLNHKAYYFTVCALQGLILLFFSFKKNINNSQNTITHEETFSKMSSRISLLELLSYFNHINKLVFINSIIPLLKIGLIKILIMREINDSNNYLNNNFEEKQGCIKYFTLNIKESKVGLSNLLNNYLNLESTKNILNNPNKIKDLKEKKFSIKSDNNLDSLTINSLSELAYLKVISLDLEIDLNFSSKQQKFKINYLREKNKNSDKLDEKMSQENEEENETIKVERKYQIESNIIRILKCKKIISHQGLINETLYALSSYFVPNIAMIKLRIENLIERGFISRDQNDYNKYTYEM